MSYTHIPARPGRKQFTQIVVPQTGEVHEIPVNTGFEDGSLGFHVNVIGDQIRLFWQEDRTVLREGLTAIVHNRPSARAIARVHRWEGDD